MTGRPSLYTQELGEEVVRRLSGGETLVSICKSDHMPTTRTISNWRKEHTDFDLHFLAARDDGFDAIAAECLQIADTPNVGTETVTKADGAIETREGDMLGHRKLQVETRLKLLSKWDPRRYGDRLQLAGDPEQPLCQVSDKDLDARIAELMAKGRGT